MNRYRIGDKLGDGTFGTVYFGIHIATNEKVAIKRMKKSYDTWEECMKLRELRSLVEMSLEDHENIVQLQEVVRESNSQLYFIFEYMPDGNLYEFIKRHSPQQQQQSSSRFKSSLISESTIRSILYQTMAGLSFLHSKGYVHRDVKPENILLCGSVCKLADFGLARECACQDPMTDYVSTRWYRAPEVLLRSSSYGKPIDLFGMGCIIAELYSTEALFPGETEVDQLIKLFQVLGPMMPQWQEGERLVEKLGIVLPSQQSKNNSSTTTKASNGTTTTRLQQQQQQQCRRIIKTRVPSASKSAIDLIHALIQWNPKDRLTCEGALHHEYFSSYSHHNNNSSNKRPLLQAQYSCLTTIKTSEPVTKKSRRDVSPHSIQDAFLAEETTTTTTTNIDPFASPSAYHHYC